MIVWLFTHKHSVALLLPVFVSIWKTVGRRLVDSCARWDKVDLVKKHVYYYDSKL